MMRRGGRHFLQIPGPTNVPDRILRAIDIFNRPIMFKLKLLKNSIHRVAVFTTLLSKHDKRKFILVVSQFIVVVGLTHFLGNS